MKPAWLLVAAFALCPLSTAHARGHIVFSGCNGDESVDFGPRHDPADARAAITTVDGDVTLVLTNDLVALQLSEHRYRDVRRQLRAHADEDDFALAAAIKTVVISTVRTVLAHSMECPLDQLRDVRLEAGRLVFVSGHGRRPFGRIRIDDEDVMSGFSQHDALAFVEAFHRAKADAR